MKALNTKKSDVVGIVDIPEEITVEILAKLAVKPLSRFKCVSKSWLSLIESKSFINKHLRNSETNRSSLIDGNSMIFFNKQSNERPVIFKFKSIVHDLLSVWHEPATGSILGCFNGVLCHLKGGRLFFSNPATRISNKLPKLEIFNAARLIVEGGIGFVAHMNHEIRCGFGWDEETDAYKVFVCMFDSDLRNWVAKVYSSKTNSWETVECGGMFSRRMIFNCIVGVFAYGKLHWISESDEHSRVEYFDLKSEVFGMVDLPPRPQQTRGGVWSLRESRGCLYALYEANDDDVDSLDDDDNVENDDDDDDDDVYSLERFFDVWVMEIYGVKESWVKKCTIPISYDKIEYPNSHNMDDEVNIAHYCQQQYVYVESLVTPIVDESNSDESDESDL